MATRFQYSSKMYSFGLNRKNKIIRFGTMGERMVTMSFLVDYPLRVHGIFHGWCL